VTESSDFTTPLDDGPAVHAEGSLHQPEAASDGEPTPVVEPEGESGPEVPAEPEVVAEPEPQPEPEREPLVVSAEDLQTAIESVRTAIRAGESVVFPTDTVYGIAADPFSPEAVQGLLDAKHRGRDMPPPVLIGDAEVLEAYTREVPAAARLLANRYWPGPLTLILQAQTSLRMNLGETKGRIGLRVPDHEVARAILRATGPLAVSSANISGEPAATDEQDARRQLRGSVAVYVDGGPTPGPTPSTIVDFSDDLSGRVLRVGAIPLDELRRLLPGLEGPEPDPVPEETIAEPDSTDAAVPDATASDSEVSDAAATTESGEPTDATPAGTEETTS
jgi:tRNA threonylcarbamoyl adenosine modification protein (Sua5/YciO/YrdC/YwlC family)